MTVVETDPIALTEVWFGGDVCFDQLKFTFQLRY